MPLHLIYTAVFGVAFPFPGILWSSLYCGVSELWVGLDRWLVKVSWLGKLVSGVLVGGAGFPLCGVQ